LVDGMVITYRVNDDYDERSYDEQYSKNGVYNVYISRNT